MVIFEKGEYTIDQKIKVWIYKFPLVNNRDFLQLLSELINDSTNTEERIEYYKQRATLFYEIKNYQK